MALKKVADLPTSAKCAEAISRKRDGILREVDDVLKELKECQRRRDNSFPLSIHTRAFYSEGKQSNDKIRRKFPSKFCYCNEGENRIHKEGKQRLF